MASPQVVRVKVEGTPLPDHLKRKWASNKEISSAKSKTIEEIEAKLLAAGQRREMLRKARGVATALKGDRGQGGEEDGQSAAKRLQDKLAAAGQKRQEILEGVRARAAERAERASKAAAALRQRQAELGARLEAHLAAAEALRGARLAETAAKAAGVAARAKEVKAEMDMRAEMEVTRRRLALLEKLERAAVVRKESVEARLAGMPQNSNEGFLQRQATKRAQLRRQSSSRKLQRCWRSFAASSQTTRALAQALVDTGVPFSVVLQPAPLGPSPALQPAPALAAAPANLAPALVVASAAPAQPNLGVSAGPTPFSTPDPCSSPTTTVRRADGSPLLGRSVPQTPDNTPLPTPGSSPPARLALGLGFPHQPSQGAPRPAALAPAPTPASAPLLPQQHPQHAEHPQQPLCPPPGIVVVGLGAGRSPLQHTVAAAKHPFDEFAAAISAPGTLRAAGALLGRLDTKLAIKGQGAVGSCEGLLRRLFPRAPKGKALERYPPRIFLCAYMVLAHPDVVFNASGEREESLASAARDMLTSFEALLSRLVEGGKFKAVQVGPAPVEGAGTLGSGRSVLSSPGMLGVARRRTSSTDSEAGSEESGSLSFRSSLSSRELSLRGSREASLEFAAPSDAPTGDSAGAPGTGAPAAPTVPAGLLLQRFDEAWVAYLEQFAAWKLTDAAGLESELIRMAVELEASKLAKVAPEVAGRAMAWRRSEEDRQALVEQVAHDLRLISERVRKLTGQQGLARLEAALAAARAAAAASAAAELALPSAAGAAMEAGAAQPPPSPTSSPLRKVARREGQYSGGSEDMGAGSPSAARTLFRSDSRPAANAPVDMDAALAQTDGNLALMWHLLYDANWQFSSAELELAWRDATGESDPMQEPAVPSEVEEQQAPEVLTRSVHSRVRRITEKAFWDSVAERLSGGAGEGEGQEESFVSDSGERRQQSREESEQGQHGREERRREAAEQVAGILSDLGRQLAEVLPEGSPIAGEVRARLGAEAVRSALLAAPVAGAAPPLLPGLNAPALFALLEWVAGAVRALGAPAREGPALRAFSDVTAALRAAGAAHAPALVAATAAARGLRLLCVLLKQLRVDIANAQLAALARQLRRGGGAGVAYARAKLEGILGAPEGTAEVAARLPHARGWLAVASSLLPHVEQQVASASLPPHAARHGTQHAQQQLPVMRSGRGVQTAQQAQQQQAPAGMAELVAPVAVRSWRGLVRIGLVKLVSGEGAVGRMAMPEALRLDAGRLHNAQNEFQRCVVLTMCLLLMRQSMQGAGQAVTAAHVAVAKRRLDAILADPAMRLADLATELSRLSGGGPSAQREKILQDGLKRMLVRSGGAMRALTTGLTQALHVLLLVGPASAHAQTLAGAALARCGAEALRPEVAQLAARLGEVTAVGEAVFEPWYAAITADLI